MMPCLQNIKHSRSWHYLVRSYQKIVKESKVMAKIYNYDVMFDDTSIDVSKEVALR